MTQTPETRIFSSSHRSVSPLKSGHDSSTSRERFPSFDHSTPPNLQVNSNIIAESPSEITPGPIPNGELRWPPRKMSQRLRDARPAGFHGHRHKRSVSDAFHRIRTRQGSVSENAHELAEALKAPVSYKLIVYLPSLECRSLLTCAGTVYCLVHDFRAHQYFVQIDSQRLP
jgi:hypothetical protein